MKDRIVNVADEARPHVFSSVVGQDFAQGVGKQIGQGRISGQGYILAGPKGCGKTSVARIIAMSVNCYNRDGSTGDPCLECASCTSILKDANPYVSEINAAAHRGINDIRESLKSISLHTPKGYRVYILDEIHMLSPDAFSFLLKPMENPPRGVIFIATTTNPEKIPETIVSRVPIIPIAPLSNDDVRSVLLRVIENNKQEDDAWKNVTEDDIRHAIRSSSGSARQAITTLSGIIFHGVSHGSETQAIDSIVDSICQGNAPKVLRTCMDALSDKKVHPVAVVRGVMDSIFSVELGDVDKGSEEEEYLTLVVSHLAGVSSGLTASTPTIMTSSRIAECVVKAQSQLGEHSTLADKSAQPQKRPRVAGGVQNTKQSKTTLNKQWDHAGSSEGQDGDYSDHHSSQEGQSGGQETKNHSSDSHNGVGKDSVSAREDIRMHISRNTRVDDVIAHIFDTPYGKDVIDNKYLDILDDPDASDIVIDTGVLYVSVKSPDNDLRHQLDQLFDNMILGKLGDSRDNPPF